MQGQQREGAQRGVHEGAGGALAPPALGWAAGRRTAAAASGGGGGGSGGPATAGHARALAVDAVHGLGQARGLPRTARGRGQVRRGRGAPGAAAAQGRGVRRPRALGQHRRGSEGVSGATAAPRLQFQAPRLHVAEEAVERDGPGGRRGGGRRRRGGCCGRGGGRGGRQVFGAEAVHVDDCGVEVPQVDDFGLLVPVLVEDRVRADEEEDADAHDEGPENLELVRVQVAREDAEEEAHRRGGGGRGGDSRRRRASGRAGGTGVDTPWSPRVAPGPVFAATAAAVGGGRDAVAAARRRQLLTPLPIGPRGLGPVAHHRHGYAHQQHQDPAEGDEPRDGAQLQLAFHHHHIVLAPLFGFPLALGDLTWGAEWILLSGGNPQQAAGGDHGELVDCRTSLWDGGLLREGANCPLAAQPPPPAAKQRKTVRGCRLGCSGISRCSCPTPRSHSMCAPNPRAFIH